MSGKRRGESRKRRAESGERKSRGKRPPLILRCRGCGGFFEQSLFLKWPVVALAAHLAERVTCRDEYLGDLRQLVVVADRTLGIRDTLHLVSTPRGIELWGTTPSGECHCFQRFFSAACEAAKLRAVARLRELINYPY